MMKKLVSILSPGILLGLFLFSCQLQAKEAVVLVHGLNNPPEIMKDLGDYVEGLGFVTRYVTLTGHDASCSENLQEITVENWYDDVEAVYRELKKNYEKVHLIAFSLGGAVSTGLQLERPNVRFDKTILFAPAISTYSYTSLVLPAGKLVSKVGLNVVSFTKVRVRDSLHWKYYQELFKIQQRIKAKSKQDFEQINKETYVFINKLDPLVSLGGTRSLTKRKGLSKWRVRSLDTDSWNGHEILLKRWLGQENWDKLIKELKQYLAP